MTETKIATLEIDEKNQISIPADVFNTIAEAAKLKYKFRGSSKATVKKYVKRYIEEAIAEHVREIEVPNWALPKKGSDK